MRIFGAEVAKLWRTTPLAVYLLACMAVNLLIGVSGPSGDYPRFVATATSGGATGSDGFASRLASDRASQSDVFAEFSTTALTDSYLRAVDYQGGAARAITAKYAYAAPLVAQLSAEGRAFDTYYASDTDYVHGYVFGILLAAVTVEAFVFAGLAGAQLRAVEEQGGPGQVLHATRRGRRILATKVGVVLASSAAGYAVLAATAVAAAGLRYDLAGVWHGSVGSSFHHLVDLVVGERPFFTWLDLDVGGYLTATLLVGLALTVAVSIASCAVGALVPNSYLGFGLLLLIAALLLTAPTIAGASLASMLSALNPIWLWLRQSIWFTDGGLDVPVPYFETVGALASILLASAAMLIAGRLFGRRDLT